MTKHQRKLLLAAGGALAAMLVAALAMPWFRLHLDVSGLGDARIPFDSAQLSVGLHTASACIAHGPCASTSLDNLNGSYPSLATYTYWVTLLLSGLVALQAGARLVTGRANPALSNGGYVIAVLALAGAGLTAFVFAPESAESMAGSVVVQRTWAAALILVGYGLAVYALYLAVADDPWDDSEATALPVAVARPPASDVMPSQPIVPIARSRVPDSVSLEPEPLPRPTPTPVPQQLPDCPEALRDRLAYATLVATFTAAGLEAQREDGRDCRVAWGDVVGVVARRLPAEPPYDGITFVDLVSVTGSTLRILPWTAVGGALTLPFDADVPERARAFVQLIAARCPEARLDGATRTFLGGRGQAAQLPNVDTLAQHDARLA